MNFSNEPIDVVRIIQLFIPIITFTMGYFLTTINSRRSMKRTILKERFKELYQPFFIMVLSSKEDGSPFNNVHIDDKKVDELLTFLTVNIYLASMEAQQKLSNVMKLMSEVQAKKDEDSETAEDTELVERYEKDTTKLIFLLIREYFQTARKLGYEIKEGEKIEFK